jgi:hypothetical protein
MRTPRQIAALALAAYMSFVPARSQTAYGPPDLRRFADSTDFAAVLDDPWVARALDYALGPATALLRDDLAVPRGHVELRSTASTPGWFILLRGHSRSPRGGSAVLALRIANARVEVEAAARHGGSADEWTTGSETFDAPDSPVSRFLTPPGAASSSFTWHQDGDTASFDVGYRDCGRRLGPDC